MDGFDNDLSFVVMQYLGPNQAASILPIDHPNFNITWKYPNPLRHDIQACKLRRILADSLGIGEHEAD